MPDTLPSIIKRFEFVYDNDGAAAGTRPPLTVYITVVLRDGRPCRISSAATATGSLESGLLHGFFDAVNAHLDRGVTLAELAPLFRATKFEPTCMMQLDGQAHTATSPLDAIFAWLCERFPEAAAC